MKSTTKVNTKTLLRHAFDTMKRLNSKLLTVDEAKAQSGLLKQSNNILKYELDKAKAIVKYENIKINEIEEEEIQE